MRGERFNFSFLRPSFIKRGLAIQSTLQEWVNENNGWKIHSAGHHTEKCPERAYHEELTNGARVEMTSW